MECFKKGGSITRPPLLDGLNYSYWKAKVTAFLRSIDTKTWKVVCTGLMTPTVTDKSEPKATGTEKRRKQCYIQSYEGTQKVRMSRLQ
ncbi:hypothetical protein LIER_26236 [Lithospermum erythrorhizon]|uniref:Gag-pol polyprotein n=1 Tax=Lithospermum erythrorhizon TaxID=34254 RepID=A0AAV3RBB1_LITER